MNAQMLVAFHHVQRAVQIAACVTDVVDEPVPVGQEQLVERAWALGRD